MLPLFEHTGGRWRGGVEVSPAGALVLVALLPWLVQEGAHSLSLCNAGHHLSTINITIYSYVDCQ